MRIEGFLARFFFGRPATVVVVAVETTVDEMVLSASSMASSALRFLRGCLGAFAGGSAAGGGSAASGSAAGGGSAAAWTFCFFFGRLVVAFVLGVAFASTMVVLIAGVVLL